VILVTADHGNLEEMFHPDGTPHVSHTANLVPFLLIDPRGPSHVKVRDGELADIAPTVLHALGLATPDAMSGKPLTPEHEWGGRRRVLQLILDGWGIGKEDNTNPIWLAPTPVWDDLTRRVPCGRLQAAGEAVGLRQGKPGNSEAGHSNMGAGRVVLQDDVRLDLAMDDGSFESNRVLSHAIEGVRRLGTGLHLIGLLSERSSHGSIDYPLAILRMAKTAGLSQVYLHIILDGRSTAPGSAPGLLERLEHQLDEIGAGRIVSAMGRGIALDRDGDYRKTQRAYDALVYGTGRHCAAQ
jgi:2,3-bisphosphoglycerate-independent phosphoglycerate mutase